MKRVNLVYNEDIINEEEWTFNIHRKWMKRLDTLSTSIYTNSDKFNNELLLLLDNINKSDAFLNTVYYKYSSDLAVILNDCTRFKLDVSKTIDTICRHDMNFKYLVRNYNKEEDNEIR